MDKDDHPSDSTQESADTNCSHNSYELVEFAFDEENGTSIRRAFPDDPEHRVAVEILSQPLARVDLVPLLVEALRLGQRRARKEALNEVQAALDFMVGSRQ